MAKIKYYYKDENGNEVLARTSNNEYHYYCYGKCSKKIDNVDSEKRYYLKRNYEHLKWLEEYDYDRLIKQPNIYKPYIEEMKDAEVRQKDIENTKEIIKRIEAVKIYELYTK